MPDGRSCATILSVISRPDGTSTRYTLPRIGQARELCERFTMHYSSKHGSWLNMAEIEIGLSGLDRRIVLVTEFKADVKAYLVKKNAEAKPTATSSLTRKPGSGLRLFIRQFELNATLEGIRLQLLRRRRR